MDSITVTLPLRLVSEANRRDHHHVKARRVAEQRAVTRMAVSARMGGRAGLAASSRFRVTLTRIAPRRLDGDNLQSAFKAVRDSVSDVLGIDDADPRIEWVYEQRVSRVVRTLAVHHKPYGAEIRIEGI